jgi:hypothetical protein
MMGAAEQTSGAAWEAWCDGQHLAAMALGILADIDHYGPEVRHLRQGAYRIVGKAPPDYLGMLVGGRHLAVEAKRRKNRLVVEPKPRRKGDPPDRDAIEPHQAARLAKVEAGGGLALVLVEFVRASGVSRFVAPWSVEVAAARSPMGGARSVGPEDLRGWEVDARCYLSRFV